MRWRNRSTGPDSVLTEFHPFTRLPIELRYTIWHLTLQPRVVEIEFQWKERYGINNEDKLYASYYSRIPLPVALKVCRDSRNAVLPFYPLCFASFLSRPKIRFNLFFDTLYIDDTFGKHLFELLGNLNPIKMAGLQNMAISDLAGSNYYEDDDKGHKYWARLGTLIEKIFGLKNILTVHSLPSILRHNYMAAMK
ncbi:uncharacterized protein PAC_12801 [Phialocephala subalpina]|uniref:2EXR domain-containing protein n=1 Tax=Phialocephala subalpina TaxID=576137 RepID=A0A1L7XCZ9_9HELO|nr:uncharacterized protein PAC_12801 [Phialocephala subalpina]